ncbi:fasciclin domain-containing protein [Kitasatospora sp. YST-16]|uniref:fasciclin domain-containing protein n=1 Tax=Kitasatospora sp. YST-16 TaxID=2998080 RepID=UPI0022833885|nr:fasciclin domain-containing protein [Kitasatospora sp. YST-16]WAL76121.1 fasciclin domain-containing protein [Kitasatospora sp. YST-16]WNW42176.1 fasciclin domain-containing protein [Streptomyces sp. Li-HN-5-13]
MSASTRNRRTFTALLAAGALALTLGACSSSGGGTSSSSATTGATAASSAAMSSPTASAAMADAPFGAACAAVPKDGAGSFTGMAKDPVATAASNNPLLSTLVTAVKQAGLVDTLNSAQNITVFAPTNDAFAKIPKADLDALLADKAKLTKVLTYHVTPDRLAPTALAGTHKTLEGSDLTVTGTQPDFTVNTNSKVLCGNVQTANATVYIVDTVLMPTS